MLLSFSHIADIIWQATAAERPVCHENLRCPTPQAPYGSEDPTALKVHAECRSSGCLDLVHDLWIHVKVALDKSTATSVSNPGGYIRRVITTRLADRRREDRVSRGFPAKPSRTDGAAGRVVEALQARGTRGEWLVRVFRILRCCPYGKRHVPGSWPVDGLVQERVAMGETINAAEAMRDISEVLQVSADVLGARWVHDNLTLPMRNNGPGAPLRDADAIAEAPSIERALGRMLDETYRRLRRSGRSDNDALKEAVRIVCGVEVDVDQELRDALEEFRDSQ